MSSTVLSIVVVILVLTFEPVSAQTRGYQSRSSGWDLDFNGNLGEAVGSDVAICDGAGGTDEDIDRNGVADRQIYVDLTTGADTTSCGAPTSPCGTLQYAMDGSNTGFTDRIRAPASNQIQAVCFSGTANATVSWTQNGSAGTYTRRATGNQVRSFEYPRYPFILSGWDVDGDNVYPPHDPDDVSVVDGNITSNSDWFVPEVSDNRSRIEVAHFTARDYGRACKAGGGGFVYFQPGSHVYYHDIDVLDVNRACALASETQIFNNFVNGNITWTAVENVRVQNWGSFWWRGTPAAGTNGPYRFQNITATSLGADGSQIAVTKPWGEIDGIEVLDSVWDLNVAAWGETDISGITGLNFAQCTRDVDIVNNEIIDFKVSIDIQPFGGSMFCITRNQDNIRIDRNIIRNTASTWVGFGHVGIYINEGDGGVTVEDVDITNNFISSTASSWRSGIFSSASVNTGTQAGTIRIVGNTIWGHSAAYDLGAIAVCADSCAANKQNNYTIYNNVIGGGAAGGYNIVVTFAPAAWMADGNIYQAGMSYTWNHIRTAFNGYQMACQDGGRKCDPGSTDSCTPSFVHVLGGDFHLAPGDVCAHDRGVDMSAITRIDIDSNTRPSGNAWDVGADETGSGIQVPRMPTNVTVVRGR